MKRKKLSSLLFIICSIFLIACSDDDGFKDIDLEDTPYYVNAFLKNVFPKDTPDKIIKLKSPDAEGTQFIATYANGIKVNFDKEGVWQQVVSTQGVSLDEASSTLVLEGVKETIRELYHEVPIMGVKKMGDGESFLLGNDQELYFIGSTLLGSVLPVAEYESLPGKIRQFVSEYFPEAACTILVKASEAEEYASLYHLWLSNGFHLAFNTHNDWGIIEGTANHAVFEAAVNTLPDRLRSELQRLYPDAQISEMYRYGENAYLIKVSSDTTHDYNPDLYDIIWPNEQITAFMETYFGKYYSLSYRSMILSNQRIFQVVMPNGFDLFVDKAGSWTVLDGHGHPFPDALSEIVPGAAFNFLKEITPEAVITKIDRTVSYGYLIVTTDGKKYKFDTSGNFIEEDTSEIAPSQKVINYIRYHYPEDTDYSFVSWGKDGFVYTLRDKTIQLRFDIEGNPIN